MKTEEFLSRCVGEGFEWAEGGYGGEEGIYVRNPRIGTCAHFKKEAVEGNDWDILKTQVLQGKDIYHVTRIVGYFSRIENWNKSKLGELKDRRQGSYSVR
ncbi:MAG: hypothetical protein PHO00_03695 [bacterium]|nr:hypothetical protein [bacterium]